jgi:uncharacterized radical SAM superfamily protein
LKLKDIYEADFQVLDAVKAIKTLAQNGIKAVRSTDIEFEGKKIQRIAIQPSEARVGKDILIKAGNYFDPKMGEMGN